MCNLLAALWQVLKVALLARQRPENGLTSFKTCFSAKFTGANG